MKKYTALLRYLTKYINKEDKLFKKNLLLISVITFIIFTLIGVLFGTITTQARVNELKKQQKEQEEKVIQQIIQKFQRRDFSPQRTIPQ